MHWHSPELASKIEKARRQCRNSCLLSLSRIEAMPSAFWSAESEALHSAEHYGPLKTRLYHSAKHCGPLKTTAKSNMSRVTHSEPGYL